jgi:hypothetical protein
MLAARSNVDSAALGGLVLVLEKAMCIDSVKSKKELRSQGSDQDV